MQVAIFCFEKFIFICSQFEFNAISDDYEAGVTCVTDFVSGEEDSRWNQMESHILLVSKIQF